ncbi:unnamed protein product [Lupinus luteus]|uniref:Helicase ATP-binding domain-containing protein n=1 Tax=Lupinus luteus TaxID=3873 RepID=A0AAV1X711_LUPLU
MTDIQRVSLPHALYGRDILGAAKTGSGKTFAFIIPVTERWGPEDGVGSIIISPTRELAGQLFDVLKAVGKHHNFSVGLLIGGHKDVDMEKEHVLVLDEAGRILDSGFKRELNAIISELPTRRQTLLFSARLSLNDLEYMSVHEESVTPTPTLLKQTVMVVPLDQKLDMLWRFIKTHLESKIHVSLSSCKHVTPFSCNKLVESIVKEKLTTFVNRVLDVISTIIHNIERCEDQPTSEYKKHMWRISVWGYFSQRTGLLVQFEDSYWLKLKFPGTDTIFWETKVQSLIQDYREVDGIHVAHSGNTCVSLSRFGEGPESHSRTRMEETWEIEEVDFNIKGLSMDCFLGLSDFKRDEEKGVAECGVVANNAKLPYKTWSSSVKISASRVVAINVDDSSESESDEN